MARVSIESDARFEALADTAPDGIVVIDDDSIIRFANAAVQRMLGWPPDELVGQPIQVILPDCSSPWRSCAISGRHKDGHTIPVEITFGEFVGSDGERRYSAFIRDVSDRVRAQQALKEARTRAEQALRELRRINAVTDVAMAQVTYDEMLDQLLARLRTELKADEATVLLLDHSRADLEVRAATKSPEIPDDHARVPLGTGVAGRVAAAALPVIIHDTSIVETKSSRVRALGSLAAVPVISEGTVIGVLHVGSLQKNYFADDDIRLLQIVSDRMSGALARTRHFQELTRLRVESLRHADEERALRSLAQAITGAVRIPEVMHQIVEGALTVSGASGAYVEQVQPDRTDVEIVAAAGDRTPPVGTRVPYPGSLTEDIMGSAAPVFLSGMKGIGTAIEATLAPMCRDCSALVTPIRLGEQVLGALVLLHPGHTPFGDEVLSRVRILGELASIALQRLIALADSERRRAEAERAVRARDEVLSIVSHDLRNPVGTVAMSASLLRDPEITLSDDQRSQQLGIISRSAQRMNRLIQDLLDVAKIEGGRLTIVCRCEEASPLATEACESFQSVAKDKSLSLECSAAVGLPKIYVDRDRILQVLSNFLNNAVKFTPAGGLITLRAQHGPEGGVEFTVSDTGPGIPEDELPRVFDRFWQSRHTAHLGSGLGLAIAAGIAQAHRGRVAASSTVGSGSTFSLILPLSKECQP